MPIRLDGYEGVAMWETGDAVWRIQALLGFVGLDVTGDGVYGPETSAAVRKFQAARGLSPTGIADDGTMVDLESAFNEGWRVGEPSAAAAPVAVKPAAGPPAPVKPAGGTSPPWLLIGGIGVTALWMMSGKKSGSGKRRKRR